jgi:glycosyltransferase involved in cell wall biosynthesis
MLELSVKKVVYLSDYDPSNADHVVITFDGIYKNVFQYAAPILEKFQYPFELFLTSDYIGRDNSFDSVEPLAEFATEVELQEMTKMGGRLQWHTPSHPRMDAIASPDQAKNELTVPEKVRRLDPKGFSWFAYPHGILAEQYMKIVKNNFEGAVSCIQGDNTDRYKLNRYTVTEDSSFREKTLGVIMPSYNYGHFLYEAFESVISQTLSPDKILIIDDASTDNTREIGEALTKRYPELVSFVRNEKNLGIVETFNKAVNLMDTDYLCFLGADNRFSTRYLEEGYQALARGADISYSNFVLFGDRARLVFSDFPEDWRGDEIASDAFLVNFPDYKNGGLGILKSGKNFIHGSSIFKKSYFLKVGGYIEKSDQPEDYGLFLRMCEAGATAEKMQTAFLEYRQHSEGQANIRLGAYNTMLFYRSELKKVQEDARSIYQQLIESQHQLEHLNWQIHQIYHVLSPFQLARIWLARIKNRLKAKLKR